LAEETLMERPVIASTDAGVTLFAVGAGLVVAVRCCGLPRACRVSGVGPREERPEGCQGWRSRIPKRTRVQIDPPPQGKGRSFTKPVFNSRHLIKATTLLLLLSTTTLAVGQCTVALPANAISVTTIQGTLISTGQFVWVCAGGLAAVTGNGNTVVVEEMGTGTVIGKNNILVSKAPGTYVSGSNNAIFIGDAADVADLGTGTQITECPTITFTYTNAPDTGCLNAGVAETTDAVRFDLFPDPVDHELCMTVEGARITRARLFDIQGRIAFDRIGNVTGKMDVSKLPSGMFLFVADTDHGQVVRRLVKN